jgi:hypothetical protein
MMLSTERTGVATVSHMSDEPAAEARGLLAELEERLARKDLGQITDLFSENVVLIGDEVENFDRASTVAYLGLMAGMTPTVRWDWDRVTVVLSMPGVLSFAAAGSMWFDDEAGKRMSDPQPFRVTCVAVDEGDRWRWKHFHGSRPAED